MEFCGKSATCGRPGGHLGCCTPAPGPRTRLFDQRRETVAEQHVRRAVEGSNLSAHASVAGVMPEYLPRRYGGTLS